ncbi:AlbA family DNA-binding domain-containing protein [Rhodohalobacter halophilus]|uniref:AlbA family DNA-binding domain-containing protein n=1 Tax=Rhodohalobacter halophilus TaxID=1812810 RepID=UPI000A033C84|nr:ATP-binding protein [Rhodohalobacter halophilus]
MKLPNGEIVISDMNPSDLRNLIQTGEGTYLEFKKTVPTPAKIAREIAAFANTSGGTILIGVQDDKQITGIRSFFEEEFLLQEAAQKLCVPAVELQIELVHLSDADVIVVRVPESKKKPVYLKGKKKRRVFVRFQDESTLASDEQTEILKQQYSESGVTFEYGKHEQMLFRYLNEYGEISVQKFSELINVTSYRASKILVNLVSAGILKLFRKSEKDYFTFSNPVK